MTLAELLAYDLDQEFYDDSLVTERDKVYEIHAAPYAALLWTGQ